MIFSLKNDGIHEGAESMKPLMKTVFFISRWNKIDNALLEQQSEKKGMPKSVEKCRFRAFMVEKRHNFTNFFKIFFLIS